MVVNNLDSAVNTFLSVFIKQNENEEIKLQIQSLRDENERLKKRLNANQKQEQKQEHEPGGVVEIFDVDNFDVDKDLNDSMSQDDKVSLLMEKVKKFKKQRDDFYVALKEKISSDIDPYDYIATYPQLKAKLQFLVAEINKAANENDTNRLEQLNTPFRSVDIAIKLTKEYAKEQFENLLTIVRKEAVSNQFAYDQCKAVTVIEVTGIFRGDDPKTKLLATPFMRKFFKKNAAPLMFLHRTNILKIIPAGLRTEYNLVPAFPYFLLRAVTVVFPIDDPDIQDNKERMEWIKDIWEKLKTDVISKEERFKLDYIHNMEAFQDSYNMMKEKIPLEVLKYNSIDDMRTAQDNLYSEAYMERVMKKKALWMLLHKSKEEISTMSLQEILHAASLITNEEVAFDLDVHEARAIIHALPDHFDKNSEEGKGVYRDAFRLELFIHLSSLYKLKDLTKVHMEHKGWSMVENKKVDVDKKIPTVKIGRGNLHSALQEKLNKGRTKFDIKSALQERLNKDSTNVDPPKGDPPKIDLKIALQEKLKKGLTKVDSKSAPQEKQNKNKNEHTVAPMTQAIGAAVRQTNISSFFGYNKNQKAIHEGQEKIGMMDELKNKLAKRNAQIQSSAMIEYTSKMKQLRKASKQGDTRKIERILSRAKRQDLLNHIDDLILELIGTKHAPCIPFLLRSPYTDILNRLQDFLRGAKKNNTLISTIVDTLLERCGGRPEEALFYLLESNHEKAVSYIVNNHEIDTDNFNDEYLRLSIDKPALLKILVRIPSFKNYLANQRVLRSKQTHKTK